ncbi:MAG: hypothetical protein EPN62_00830 [Candidimonas sp.]|nr:MAG: hypothetical protein EPN77_01830 [Candidimonas sp.]TAM26874.1 MAG: hypothetical protein EPN62_00830 [Candidimonas sp.]
MNPQLAFQPAQSQANPPACTAQIAVTTAAQLLTLPVSNNPNGTMRIVVSGTANVAWCYSDKNALTMATGVLMLANTSEVFALPGSVTAITVIGAAAGSTLSVCVGDGK